jgi:hypothetical protein
VQRSLPEMNRAKMENKVPFQVFALHRGGKNEKGEKIIADKSKLGDAWVLDFLWSTPEFEKQFGGVKGLPSYYLVGSDGRVRAVLKGHSKNTMETLTWLRDQIEKHS